MRMAGNCHKSFCNNRGTCEIDRSKGADGFTCFCSTGWEGKKCESHANSKTKFERYIAHEPRIKKF